MALRGIRSTQSITIVSGNKPVTNELFVNITLPSASPYEGRVATISFGWTDQTGQPADVDGFTIASLVPGEGGELLRFVQHSRSSYSVDVQFKQQSFYWTVIVRAFSVKLLENPMITGPSADTSATMLIGAGKPIVKIGLPAGRPVTQRPVPLDFQWCYNDGEKAPVSGFDLTDISTDVGTLGNFLQATGDPSRYTADLTIPQSNTKTKVTITVSANSATVANSSPAILGPEADTARTFELAAPAPVATVTGADSVCVLEKEIITNDLLNDVVTHLGSDAGGAFAGVLECESIGDYLYMVVQIRKFTQTVDKNNALVTPANPKNFLSDAQAGAALIRVNTADCRFELLKAYSDVTLAARSLAVHGTDLYFFEGSHYMYEDEAAFSDRNWREKVGYVYKIEHPSSTILGLGRNWRSATTTDNPDTHTTDFFYGVHGGTVSPIVVQSHPETTGPVIHIITGYGNFNDIGQPLGTHPVQRAGNWHWIQYHSRLNPRVSEVQTNRRTGFDVLKDIAVITNSIIGFDNDTFFIRPREPQQAENASSGITATQRTIGAAHLNWGSFPTTGWLYINGEMIKHTGANDNGQFRNVVRGDEQTTAAAHADPFTLFFVDHVLSLNQDTLEGSPINSVVANNDNRQFYNQIQMNHGDDETVFVTDTTSLTENGVRLLEMDVPLDNHQRVWADWLARSYLARFKDIHQIINLTLKPTYFIHVGDVVYLKIPDRLHLDGTLCQVLEIKFDFRHPPTTAVKLVTL